MSDYNAPASGGSDQFVPPPSAYPPPPPLAEAPPYPAAHDRPQPQHNGLAITGFVTGLLGLVLFWLPIVGLVLSVLGIVFGAIGVSQAKKTGAPKGLGQAGLVLGILGVVVPVALVVVALRAP